MCKICEIIWEEGEGIHEGKYKFFLKNGWSLNHSNAPDSYLGYLMLSASQKNKNQPHISDFDNLQEIQVVVLGKYLLWIQCKLKEYWIKSDPIEQVHFAFLNERPYKDLYRNKLKRNEVEKHLHVHIHIFPRTKSMGEFSGGEKIGWELLDFVKTFKCEYLHKLSGEKKLMLFLKKAAQKDGIYANNPD